MHALRIPPGHAFPPFGEIHEIFILEWFSCNRLRRYSSKFLYRILRGFFEAVARRSMKFIVEIPDCEVLDAAEQPGGLACEIAEVIANEIYSFSALTVIPLQRSEDTLDMVRF